MNPITIRTYDRLHEKIDAWVNRAYKFLVLLGPSGKGKSWAVTDAIEQKLELLKEKNLDSKDGTGATSNAETDMGHDGQDEDITEDRDPYHLLKGVGSHFQLFRDGFYYRDEADYFVLDDLKNVDGYGLSSFLMQFTDTNDPRVVTYRTANRQLEREGIPRRYTTRCNVAVISNDWNSLKKGIPAIESRAHMIDFRPSNHAVHQYVSTWFKDEEVFNFIEQFLEVIPNIDIRYYIKGSEERLSEPEYWKDDLLDMMLPPELLTAAQVMRLCNDCSYRTDKERIGEFVSKGFGNIATFKRHKARLGLSRVNAKRHRDNMPEATPIL